MHSIHVYLSPPSLPPSPQELGEPASAVLLTSVYPRQELGPALDSRTLSELQLAPSGVVIVRTGKVRGGAGGRGKGEGQVDAALSVAVVLHDGAP